MPSVSSYLLVSFRFWSHGQARGRCGTKSEVAEKQARFPRFPRKKVRGPRACSFARSLVRSSVRQTDGCLAQRGKIRERQGASNSAAHIPSSKALPSSRICFTIQEESAMFLPAKTHIGAPSLGSASLPLHSLCKERHRPPWGSPGSRPWLLVGALLSAVAR